MTDFNPSFSFEFGQDDASIHQAPWDFKGALEHAEQPTGTTIDYKIQRKKSQQRRTDNNRKKIDNDSDDDDDDSDEEIEDDSDDDSDVPLEGEQDDSEEEIEEEDDSGEEEIEEEDSDDGAVVDDNSDEEEIEEEDDDDDSEDEEIEEEQSSEEDTNNSDIDDNDDNDHRHSKPTTTTNNNANTKNNTNNSFFDAEAAQGTSFSASSFSSLNLSRPLLRACTALGYTQPTPIQAACIPLALAGRDICGSAITGSGKTAAFSLPLLERLLHRNKRLSATYVVVLAPTRELAVQVHSMMQKLAQYTDIQVALVVGGLSLAAQASALRAGPEIVVATPGRLIDHLRNSQGFRLEDLAALVLDEADRLLEMGFKEEIHEILRLAPTKRQTMLFSATMTDEVADLISLSLRHPVRLAADATMASPSQLTQEIIRLKGAAAASKEAMLLTLVSRTLASSGRTIVFFSTKQRAHRAKILFGLADLPPAAELHGDMTQAARLESLEKFRKGDVAFLLATDVAARGLDILGVETVVNYDCPRDVASYLHRVGRTARAGANGRSITFVEDENRTLIKTVVKKSKVDLQQRKMPWSAVVSWQEKVEKMEGDVAGIIAEEREERAIRKAEMEAEKASNMLEHESEIYSRPARTWFQSERQKKEANKRAKDAVFDAHGDGELAPEIAKKVAKNAAKSARRLERKQAAAEEERKNKKARNAPMEETAAVLRQVKAVKAREQALRQDGVPASKAGKIAAAMVAGRDPNAKKNKKKENSGVGGKKDGNGLFEGDGIGGGKSGGGGVAKVYAGGAKSGKARMPTGKSLAGAALSRAKRAGKGKHSFKSKARHKRR